MNLISMILISKRVLSSISVALLLVGGFIGYFYGVNYSAARTATFFSNQTITSSSFTTSITTISLSVTSTVVSTSTATVTRTNDVINGGFEYGFSAWEALLGNHTILLTKDNPHSGSFALELKTKNSTGTALYQHFHLYDQKGECTTPGNRFGVALRPGLEFSLWYKTPNSTVDRIIVGVTFHNGTSKPSIDYLLAWNGRVPSANYMKDQGGLQAYVPILVNNSGTEWKQARFDLYQDFVNYFSLDPIENHYCVNYIVIGQNSFLNQTFGINSPPSYTYSYFDDVQLDETIQ